MKKYNKPIPQAFFLKEIKTKILQHVGNDLILQQCQGRALTKPYEVELVVIL